MTDPQLNNASTVAVYAVWSINKLSRNFISMTTLSTETRTLESQNHVKEILGW